jgi:hypothetical protein
MAVEGEEGEQMEREDHSMVKLNLAWSGEGAWGRGLYTKRERTLGGKAIPL